MPLNKTPWSSDTVMPWGEHKGTAMDAVPADYLHWLLNQKWIPDYPGLHAYLKRNSKDINEQYQDLEATKGEMEGYDSYEDYQRDIRD